MPNENEQIAIIKTQTLARMAEITAEPKPSYKVDGQSVSWTEYLKQLQQTVDWCNQQLGSQTPQEFQTRGCT
jgi:hypothetical protein